MDAKNRKKTSMVKLKYSSIFFQTFVLKYVCSTENISIQWQCVHRMQMVLIAATFSILTKYFNYIKSRDIIPVGRSIKRIKHRDIELEPFLSIFCDNRNDVKDFMAI